MQLDDLLVYIYAVGLLERHFDGIKVNIDENMSFRAFSKNIYIKTQISNKLKITTAKLKILAKHQWSVKNEENGFIIS